MVAVQSQERLDRLERLTHIPLMLLAVAMLPLLLLPPLIDLSEGITDWLDLGNWIIWGAFALALIAKVIVAPNRFTYIRTHPIEVLFVVLPMVRPLGLLRALPVLRFAVAMGVNVSLFTRFFQQRGIAFLAVMLVVVMVAGGTLVWLLERDVSGHDAHINTPLSAFWWAFITMTTVGYGDHSPLTLAGRIIAGIITVYGIINFAVISAMTVALLVQDRQQATQDEIGEVRAQLDSIQEQLSALRAEQRTPPDS